MSAKNRASKPQRVSAPPPTPGQSPAGFWEFWRAHKTAALLLLLIPAVLYGYAVTFGFVLDDVMVYTENKYVLKGLAGVPDILSHDSLHGYLGEKTRTVSVGGRYRPLSLLTFALEYQLFGLKPAISHAVNILLYGLTGLSIFRLFSRLLSGGKAGRWFLAAPFLAALLWIMHPVHSEVVANIKGRDEILALLFSVLVMHAILNSLERRSGIWLGASACLFFLALLAKENSVTFLAVVPLTLYFFTGANLRKILPSFLILGVVFAGYLLMRYLVIGYMLESGQPVTGLMNNPFLEASSQQKQATIVYTLGLYIKLLIFPHPLTHDYYPYQVPLVTWSDWRPLLALFANAGLAAWAIVLLRRRHPCAYGVLFHFITLSIVSNVPFQVGTFMNERFLYTPSVGFCLIAATLLARHLQPAEIPARRPYTLLAAVILGTMLAGYAIKTITRVPAWKDDMSLNRAGSAVSTGSARANLFMGVALYNHGRSLTNRTSKLAAYREAETYIDKALKIYPTYSDGLKMKAGVLGEIYQIDRDLDKLLDGFQKLLQVSPVPFIDEYLEYLNRRKVDVPKLTAFYHQLGWEWFAQRQKNYVQALRYLNYAYSLAPTNEQILLDLARVNLLARNRPAALSFAQKGAEIAPNNPEFRQIIRQASAP